MKESHVQSLIKAISWRVFGTLATMAIDFIMTHRLDTSFYIGLMEMLSKIILFYLHERLWIWFGKKQMRPLSAKL